MDWGGGGGAILELETFIWNLATFDGTKTSYHARKHN